MPRNFGTTKLKIMSNWKNITTRNFIRIREIIHEQQNSTKASAYIWMQIGVLEIVTKYTHEELKNMPYNELRELTKKHEWAFQYPDGDITESFKFRGRKFKAVLDAYKIKAGQFIDETELSKGSELDMIRNLNILLGVLLEEESVWYKPFRKHLTNEQKFAMVLDMPISLVYPNVVFFCKVYQHLLPNIADYLESQAVELQQIVHGLSKDGDG